MNETHARYRRNLTLIRYYGFLVGFWMHCPIMYLYLADLGLSFSRIAVVFAVVALFSLLCEVPSGAVADLCGRKYAMAVASTAYALSFVTFGIGDLYWHFLVAALLWGVADAFVSGSDTALVYDTLQELEEQTDFARHIGKRWQYWSFGFAAAALFTTPVMKFGGHYTFIASAVAAVVSLAVALLFVEPPRSQSQHSRGYLAHIREAVGLAASHVELRRLIIYQAAFIGTILVFFQYLQFFMRDAGIAREYFGVLYAYFTVLCGVGAGQAYRLVPKRKKEVFLAAMALVLLVLLAAGAVFTHVLLALLVISVIELLFKGMPQIINEFFHRHVESYQRATVDSLKNFASSISYGVLVVFIGCIADHWNYRAGVVVLAVCGAGICLAALIGSFRAGRHVSPFD